MPETSHVLAAMYSLGMYMRNNQMVAFQKSIASASIRYNAGNGVSTNILHLLEQ